MTIRAVIVFASIFFISCGGGSIERDAKKVAKIQCDAQKLMKESTSGDMSVIEKSNKLASEAAALSNEMERKYTSESDQKKFAEALIKEMGNCN